MMTRRNSRRARVSSLAEPWGQDEANPKDDSDDPDLDIDAAILVQANPPPP